MENYNEVETKAFIRKLARHVRENLDKDYPTYKFTLVCHVDELLVYIAQSDLFKHIIPAYEPLIFNLRGYFANPLFKGEEYKLLRRIRNLLVEPIVENKMQQCTVDIKIGGIFKPHKYVLIN